MSIALVEAWREKQRIKGIVKFLLRRVAHPCVLVVLAYIFPKLAIFYAICGLYDVSRNRVNVTTLRRYFLGNGFATWALSPINVFLDLISLPHINRGVYRLGDLPTAQQEEVTRLIQAAKDVDLVRQLDERAKENERTMIFFRWYGVNVDTFLDVPPSISRGSTSRPFACPSSTGEAPPQSHLAFFRPPLAGWNTLTRRPTI